MFLLQIKLRDLLAFAFGKTNINNFTSVQAENSSVSHSVEQDKFIPDLSGNKPLNELNNKSAKELMLLLLGFILKMPGYEFKFNHFTSVMQRRFMKTLKENCLPEIFDEGTINFLRDSMESLLGYLKQDSSEEKSKKSARELIANISATHPKAQLAKLLSISKDLDCSPEVRALAASIASDAISHMKQQHVGEKSAKTLMSLISSAPDDIKGLLFSALKDAKTIEENANSEKKKNKLFNPLVPYSLGHDFRDRKDLTVA